MLLEWEDDAVSHAPTNCTAAPMSELVHLAARTYCWILGSLVALHYICFSLAVRRTGLTEFFFFNSLINLFIFAVLKTKTER